MAKASSTSGTKPSKPVKPPVIVPLYAVPIKEAAASGDVRAMKSIAAKGRKHISDVQAALTKLEAAITKSRRIIHRREPARGKFIRSSVSCSHPVSTRSSTRNARTSANTGKVSVC